MRVSPLRHGAEEKKKERGAKGREGEERSILPSVPTYTLHPSVCLPTFADLRSRRSVDNAIVPRYFFFFPLTRCPVAFYLADKFDRGD